jgi:flagellar motor switch protein FliN/FliY
MEGTIENVGVEIAVMLGATKMPVHQVLRMGRGALINLGSNENEDVLLLANNIPIARAAVQVDGGRIAVSITRMLPRPVTFRD